MYSIKRTFSLKVYIESLLIFCKEMGSLPVRAGSLFKRNLSLIENITLSFIWENLRMEGTQPVRARVPSLFYINSRLSFANSETIYYVCKK